MPNPFPPEYVISIITNLSPHESFTTLEVSTHFPRTACKTVTHPPYIYVRVVFSVHSGLKRECFLPITRRKKKNKLIQIEINCRRHFNPFPTDKFLTLPYSKTLQTTILNG